MTVVYSFDIWFRDDNPEIKRKAKIIKEPVFAFEGAKQLGPHKILVYLPRWGTPTLGDITPSVSAEVCKKFEEAVRGIVFEPAMLSEGRKVSVKKVFDFK